MHLLCTAADLNAHRCGATKAEVEQQEVGLLLLEKFPIGRLTISRANHFRLRDVVADDS